MIFISILVLSHFSHAWLFVTLWTVAYQAPLSTGILQERVLEWVSMPSSRGIFVTQGSNPRLLWFLHCRSIAGTAEPLEEPHFYLYIFLKYFSFLNFQCWDVTKKTRNSTPPSVSYFKGLKISEFAQIFLKYEYHRFLPSWETKGHPWWFSG